MAAKYLPKASTPPTFNNGLTAEKENTEDAAGGSDAAKGKTMQNEKPTMEVLPERRQIVSSLDQPMSDVYFMEEYGKKARNLGFHSLTGSSPSLLRNTLKVVVDRTVRCQTKVHNCKYSYLCCNIILLFSEILLLIEFCFIISLIFLIFSPCSKYTSLGVRLSNDS